MASSTTPRVAVTVSSGLGPREVRRFVALLAEALTRCAQARGMVLESSSVRGDDNAPASVTLVFRGPAVPSKWLGTHELRAPSPFRKNHGRRRWFVSVTTQPAASVDDGASVGAIDPRDVTWKACRAKGPGGQHVNKTSSAIIALHRPSGVQVKVGSERSQHANRRLALERIAETIQRRCDARQVRVRGERRRQRLRVERGRAVQTWRADEDWTRVWEAS